jgi:hypothetical protein
MHALRNHKVRGVTVASLFLLLVVGCFQQNVRSSPVLLLTHDLASLLGAGFWTDPCTWDGFMAGAGAVLCATGSAGGCLTLALGILKAYKSDDCF